MGSNPATPTIKLKSALRRFLFYAWGVRGRYPTLCNNVGSTMSKREQVHNAVRVLTNAPQASTMPREPQDEDHKIKIGLAPVFILCLGGTGAIPHIVQQCRFDNE